MGRLICMRFGLVAGAATGLFINLLAEPTCCGSHALALGQQTAYGAIVAVMAGLLAAAFACLVSRRPCSALLLLAFLISIVAGLLLGPLAYALPHPAVAMFVCAVLGALIGILVCWLLCRGDFTFAGGSR